MNSMNSMKKGDLCYVILQWDRKGTVRVVPSEVLSAGKKQAVIRFREGDPMKRFFRPEYGPRNTSLGPCVSNPMILKDTGQSVEEIEKIALERAEEFLASERAHFARCLAMEGCNEGITSAFAKALLSCTKPASSITNS